MPQKRVKRYMSGFFAQFLRISPKLNLNSGQPQAHTDMGSMIHDCKLCLTFDPPQSWTKRLGGDETSTITHETNKQRIS